MTYVKDVNINIPCWTRDDFFNKKKKSTSKEIKFELNKSFDRNSYHNQLAVMKIDDSELYIPIDELEMALKLLKEVHSAGR